MPTWWHLPPLRRHDNKRKREREGKKKTILGKRAKTSLGKKKGKKKK
jgi:hypothetical protein